ncbi:hypothetical protein [Filimonas lacunae]|uniref:hypothetical protein n=1 Tax=Filimonas lacunae TaxID=477680 RepID=UPI00118531FD|nr:hypothetical protein [Filimonas lacunae]
MLNRFYHFTQLAALQAHRLVLFSQKRTLLCITCLILLFSAATMGSAMSKRVMITKKIRPAQQSVYNKKAADSTGFPHLYSFPSWFLSKCFRLLHIS